MIDVSGEKGRPQSGKLWWGPQMYPTCRFDARPNSFTADEIPRGSLRFEFFGCQPAACLPPTNPLTSFGFRNIRPDLSC